MRMPDRRMRSAIAAACALLAALAIAAPLAAQTGVYPLSGRRYT